MPRKLVGQEDALHSRSRNNCFSIYFLKVKLHKNDTCNIYNLILGLFTKNSKHSDPSKTRSWREVNNEADGTIFDVATCKLLK